MIAQLSSFLWRWGPAIFWAGVIFFFSSQTTLPGPEVIWWDFVLKKSAHIFVYAVLFFLLQRAINWNSTQKNWILPVLLTFLYAVSDEVHQAYTPGRTPLLSDIGYDMLGVMLAFLKLKKLI